MDGSKYDGDNPKDLIDDTSDYWDETNTSHIKSAQVKANIIEMSHYMNEISVYETAYNSASPEDKPAALATLKAEIEKRFGIKWIIDYTLLINLELNSDSIQQNAQWITWGAINEIKKWIPCPYDHDNAYGIQSTISFNFSEPAYMEYGKNDTTPIRYVYAYYQQELKQRWAELRQLKIIDKDTFINLVKDWVDCIGYDNFELEYDKWNQSPCNRASNINSKWECIGRYITYWDTASNWSSTTTYSNGSTVKFGHRCFQSLKYGNIGHSPSLDGDTEWWKDVTAKPGSYSTGDEIWDGYSNFYRFRALENIVITEDIENVDRVFDHLVNAPFSKLYSEYPHEGGCFDSLYRIYNWINEQINIIDVALEYNQN